MIGKTGRLLVALFAGALLLPAWGLADVTITVGDGAANPGENVTLSIMFEGAEEPGVISAFSIFLDFDAALLELNSSTGEPVNPTGGKGADQPNVTILTRISQEEDPNRKGKFELTGFTFSPPDMGNGENAKLTFAIPPDLPEAFYDITVTDTEVRDNTNALIPSNGVSGKITVGNPATPTPTPSPTPSDTPTPTPSATPTPTPEPTPTPMGAAWYIW